MDPIDRFFVDMAEEDRLIGLEQVRLARQAVKRGGCKEVCKCTPKKEELRDTHCKCGGGCGAIVSVKDGFCNDCQPF